MPFFIATMSHPDGDGWNRRLAAHVAYLKGLVAAGSLRASGPLIGAPLRSGFLIFTVPDRAKVEALVAADPFAVEFFGRAGAAHQAIDGVFHRR